MCEGLIRMQNTMILLIGLLLFSCNSNSPNHDSQDDRDLHDLDNSETDDNSDIDAETESDDISDADSEAECIPPLMDAPFPYYDKDGNITFCRPDCNEDTEKDPQCMSNLWKEQNQALCKQKPKYDCCGYPCVMESLRPLNKEQVEEMYTSNIAMHKCDLKINPWEWGNDGTHGVVKSWNMSEGKIGFHLVPTGIDILEWPNIRKAVTYDIETKKYSFIAPGDQMQSYHKGKRILLSGDKRPLPIDTRKKYLTYMGDDGSLGIVYPEAVEFLAYEPALNDKWAFVNLTTKGNSSRMMYAKVGDPSSGSTADSWKWTVLGEGTLRMSNLSGDRFALFTDDLVGYICDLDKSPKSLNDCYKVNQGEEGVRYLTLDKENSGRAVYSSTLGKIVLMEYKAGKWNYTDLITSYSDEVKDYAIGFIVNMVRGKTMLYEEAYQLSSSTGHYGDKLCYYNFNSQKKYCMKKMDKDEEYSGIPIYPYGDAEFEGKWLLYQKLNSTPLILRDMECYCKEEGVCPFE
jgi:hypothetical protein